MADFDHVQFNALLGSLELQPLGSREIEILRSLAANGMPLETRDNTLAVERLGDLRLVDDAEGEWDDETAIEPSDFLNQIVTRGLLAQLSPELA